MAVLVAQMRLRHHGEATFESMGTSMSPIIRPGDNLIVRSLQADKLTIGDILVFEEHGHLVVHRFVGRQGDRLLEKGDNSFVYRKLDIGAVLGKVIVVQNTASRHHYETLHWTIVNRFLGLYGYVMWYFYRLARSVKEWIWPNNHNLITRTIFRCLRVVSIGVLQFCLKVLTFVSAFRHFKKGLGDL